MHFLVALLFSIIANEGPIIDPDGGRPHLVHGGTGTCIDPNGRCVHSLDNGDGRAILDPIGRVHSDTGACIDPNGRCSRGFAGDSGGGMDPNG